MPNKPEIEGIQQLAAHESEADGNPITPIIVIGMNRSGTKWLSNILCNHSLVTGVQSERHCGILETNFFGEIERFVGNLADVQNYVALVEFWSQTDFFKATKLAKEELYQFKPRPVTCAEFFDRVMSLTARRVGSKFWLQKTSPIRCRILRRLQNPRVVIIRREILPTLESTIQLSKRQGERPKLVRSILLYVLQDKILRKVRREYAALFVEYEKLRSETHAEVERVCSGLGLLMEDNLLEIGFEKNTSFRGPNDAQRNVFSKLERAVIRALQFTFRLVPLPVLLVVNEAFRSRRPYLVVGTYSEIVERYDLH